jgi:hypothetical protein
MLLQARERGTRCKLESKKVDGSAEIKEEARLASGQVASSFVMSASILPAAKKTTSARDRQWRNSDSGLVGTVIECRNYCIRRAEIDRLPRANNRDIAQC